MKRLLNNTRRHDISFHADGRIDITARVARVLDLQDGDVIDIATDGEEYYLYVARKAGTLVGRHEAQCYKTNRRCKVSHNMRAYSIRLTSQVCTLCGTDNARLGCGTPVQHLALGMAVPIIIRKQQ